MAALTDGLREALEPPFCVVGVGNDLLGDDGFGPALAGELERSGWPAIVAGDSPEGWMERLGGGGYRSVLFLDAVDFTGEPGAAVLLDAAAIRARFPQVSTHRISLGTLAAVIESRSGARVRLLGVKPRSLAPGAGLSEPVRTTLGALKTIFTEVRRP